MEDTNKIVEFADEEIDELDLEDELEYLDLEDQLDLLLSLA
jgi:hypothetical protein